MASNWYYVIDGERQGPVEKDYIINLYRSGQLDNQSYVWCKGFENWIKIIDAEGFEDEEPPAKVDDMINSKDSGDGEFPNVIEEKLIFSSHHQEKLYYIKIGSDRGQAEVEYGPFSVEILLKLYNENRINAKTFIFSKGMGNWSLISEFANFAEVFDDVPPEIKEEDKRAFIRKPFIARMFIQNDKQVFEGICRDVSVGGMQVLIDQFPGAIGETIDINVHPEAQEHSFVASGKIVRLLEGGQGFSFRFHNLNEEAVSAISSYISE
jgi:hypothetical protein